MLTPSAYKRRQVVRKQTQRYALALLLLTVIFCGLLLTGCAATSPPVSTACPQHPTLPELSTPLPSETYSVSVRELLQTWRQKLTATFQTSD